ncbi:MAG: hypothetical protein ACI4ML_03530 [Aristaeellaceae bacterium]
MNEAITDPGRFSTTGVLNEDFLRRHVNEMLPRSTLVGLGVLTVMVTAYSLWMWRVIGSKLYLAFMAVWTVIAACRLIGYRHQVLRQLVNRLKESAPDGEMLLTTSCTEQGVRVENQTTGGVFTIGYDKLVWARETEDAVIVMSRAQQVTTFFKGSLTEHETEELLALLKEKGLRIR